MRTAIILFAKAPLAGHVKTRLQEWLGIDATLALHEAFVLDTLDKLLSLGDFADIELHTDIKTDVWRCPRVTVREQSAGDLGSKMLHALSAGFAQRGGGGFFLGGGGPPPPAPPLSNLLPPPPAPAPARPGAGGRFSLAPPPPP